MPDMIVNFFRALPAGALEFLNAVPWWGYAAVALLGLIFAVAGVVGIVQHRRDPAARYRDGADYLTRLDERVRHPEYDVEVAAELAYRHGGDFLAWKAEVEQAATYRGRADLRRLERLY